MNASSPIISSTVPAWRSKLLVGVIGLLYCLIFGRAVYIQIGGSEFFMRQGESRYARTLEMAGPRGSIFDRNGILLSASVQSNSLWTSPDDLELTADDQLKLAEALGIALPDLQDRLRGNGRFVWLKRQLSDEAERKVRSLQLKGIYFTAETARRHPVGTEISYLAGQVNNAGKALDGLEIAFDEQLRGQSAMRKVIVDRLGKVVEHIEANGNAYPGQDVRTTVDMRWQVLSDAAVKRLITQDAGIDASIVILEPATGHMLALVTQQASPPKAGPRPFPGLSRTFEPGLTLAPFVVAAGLENQAFSLDTALPDSNPALLALAGEKSRVVTRHVKVGDMLQLRVRAGLGVAGMNIRPAAFHAVLNGVGLGKTASLGIGREQEGSLLPLERWRIEDQAMISMGRRVKVTLVQLARAYATLANNGYVPALSIDLERKQGEMRPAFSEDTAAAVLNQLRHMQHKGETVRSPSATAPIVVGDSVEVTTLKLGLTQKQRSAFAVGMLGGATGVVGAVLLESTSHDRDRLEALSRDLIGVTLRAGHGWIPR